MPSRWSAAIPLMLVAVTGLISVVVSTAFADADRKIVKLWGVSNASSGNVGLLKDVLVGESRENKEMSISGQQLPDLVLAERANRYLFHSNYLPRQHESGHVLVPLEIFQGRRQFPLHGLYSEVVINPKGRGSPDIYEDWPNRICKIRFYLRRGDHFKSINSNPRPLIVLGNLDGS